MIGKGIEMPHVFISYVRENSDVIKRLCDVLRAYAIDVWLDRDQLKPGSRWAAAIREAINSGAFYIACFSKGYADRAKTYMNEELTTAIEELRLRPTDTSWFIPVLLDKCEVPDRSIGEGETLKSLQWVSLYENWDDGIRRLLSVIQPDSARIHKLITDLRDDSARVRIRAADDLGRIGRAAKMAIPALLQLLDADGDENETARAIAAFALGEIGEVNEEVVSKLLVTLEREHYEGGHATKALVKLGNDVVPLLIAELYRKSDLQAQASEALGHFSDSSVIKPLVFALTEGADWITRSNAAEALGKVGDVEVIPVLVNAYEDENDLVRAAAVHALGALGRSGLDVLAALIRAIDNPGHYDRWAAAEELGEMGSSASEAVPALIEAFRTGPWHLQWRIAEALGKIGDPAAIEPLDAILAREKAPDDQTGLVLLHCLSARNALTRSS